jgi:MFS family permease
VATLGTLFAATGIGAVGGAITVSSLGDIRWRGKLLLAGSLTFCGALIAFSFARSMYVAAPALFVVGYGMIIQMALINTLIQLSVPDKLRGRVMSVYTCMFGLMPFGCLQIGYVAHKLGVLLAIRIGATICGVVALILSPRFVGGIATRTAEKREIGQ